MGRASSTNGGPARFFEPQPGLQLESGALGLSAPDKSSQLDHARGRASSKSRAGARAPGHGPRYAQAVLYSLVSFTLSEAGAGTMFSHLASRL